MATLHVNGKVSRAKVLADPSVPIYLLFSNSTVPELDTVEIVPSTLLGAVKVSKKVLLASGSLPGGSVTNISGTTYTEFSTATPMSTLKLNKTNKVYIEGLLNTSVVPTNNIIKTVYVVSYLHGLTPSGLSPVSSSILQTNFNNLSYTIEAVQLLAQGNYITMSNSTNKLVGLILEM